MNKSLPRKYGIVAILFCFWLLLYFQRINISILIVDSQFLRDMGILNDTRGQGLYFPAQSRLISNWFVPGERSRANSIWAVAGWVIYPLLLGIRIMWVLWKLLKRVL